MEGVTTAIVGFIFVCVVYPNLVKTRPQYYGALAAVLLIILLDSLLRVIGSKFFGFATVMIAVLQVGAILLLILSCGGVTMRGLAADIGKTIEVVRRGGEKETIIVPLRGEQPRPHD